MTNERSSAGFLKTVIDYGLDQTPTAQSFPAGEYLGLSWKNMQLKYGQIKTSLTQNHDSMS